MTVTLMQTLLKEATDNADFYSPLLVLEVSSMIFRKRDAEPQEFINVRTKHPKYLWKSNVLPCTGKIDWKCSVDQQSLLGDRAIWSESIPYLVALYLLFLFLDSISAAREELPEIDHYVKWSAMDEKQRKACLDSEEDIIFRVLSTFGMLQIFLK